MNTLKLVSKFVSKMVGVAAVFMFSLTAFAQGSVYGIDTVAGFSTMLKGVGLNPHSKVEFVVKKPNGAQVLVDATADAEGKATIDFYDYHTKLAGDYKVAVRGKGNKDMSSFSSFKVYPAEVSDKKSLLTPDVQLVKANGSAQVQLKVQVKDSFGNPLEGHQITIISSRTEDEVKRLSSRAVTDKNGSITFAASSYEAGVSTFSVYDISDGVILAPRAKIVFYDSQELKASVGGSLIPVAFAQDADGSISSFKFDELPSEVPVNETITFKTLAVDGGDSVVENYTGKIHFSVEGDDTEGVTLPEDYQFTADDLGAHTFSLGLSFKTPGTYKVVVTDLNDFSLRGEKTVTVVAASEGSSSAPSSTSDSAVLGAPRIESPRSGAYNKSQQTLTGTALPGVALKIFDNDDELGTTDAAADGSFTFTTSALAEGKHELKVVALKDDGSVLASSGTVSVEIDTSGPEADEVKLVPSTGISPEDVVEVTVVSEQGLSQAAIVVGTDLVKLTEDVDNPGNYKGTFAASAEAGSYVVDVILVDALGNESQFKDKAQFEVGEATEKDSESKEAAVDEDSLDGGEGLDDPTETEVKTPSVVEGLRAYSGDTRVNLEWDAATPAEGTTIDHYRVYYGLSKDSLINAVDTFDNKTKWYVPKLENGTEYFFTVTAIDSESNESAASSEVVSSIPFIARVSTETVKSEPFQFDPTVKEYESPNEAELRAAAMARGDLDKTGPETLWLLLASFCAAYVWIGRGRRQRNL